MEIPEEKSPAMGLFSFRYFSQFIQEIPFLIQSIIPILLSVHIDLIPAVIANTKVLKT